MLHKVLLNFMEVPPKLLFFLNNFSKNFHNTPSTFLHRKMRKNHKKILRKKRAARERLCEISIGFFLNLTRK